MKSVFIGLLLMITSSSFAANVQLGIENNHVVEVGAHFPILIVKKSMNPQNEMVVYTRLDASCNLVLDSKQSNKPTFNFYWMMDRMNYKPVHSMIEAGVRRRLSVQADTGSAQSFTVIASDLSAVKHDLPSNTIQIKADKSAKGCSVAAYLQLGPSHQNEKIRIESFYADADLVGNVDKVIIEGFNTHGDKVIAEFEGR